MPKDQNQPTAAKARLQQMVGPIPPKVELRRRAIIAALAAEAKSDPELARLVSSPQLAAILQPPEDLQGATALRAALLRALRQTPKTIGVLVERGEKISTASQVARCEVLCNDRLQNERRVAIEAFHRSSTAASDTVKAFCPNCSKHREDLVDHARYFRGEAGKMGAKALSGATPFLQCLANPACPERAA